MNSDTFTKQLGQVVFGGSDLDKLSLESLLNVVSTPDDLKDLPEGTTVLIRADLDASIKDGRVRDAARLEACAPTVAFCCRKGLKPVLFGHIGRDPSNSAVPARDAMSEILAEDVGFIEDWLTRDETRLTDDSVARIREAKPGSVFMLQNTRKYGLETALWKISKNDFPLVAQKMYQVTKDIQERLARVLINEAIAASNSDFSSSAVPLLMDRVAFGFFTAKEMKTFVIDVRKANCVVFSGLKIDKLDALEGIVDRGKLKMIVAGGSLAMDLKKAHARLQGKDFCIGLAETDSSLKSYISEQRVEQAKSLLAKCQRTDTEVVLPVDFVLDDKQISKTIPKDRAQMDIGPLSRTLIQEKLEAYSSNQAQNVLFYNGVLGKYEDPSFAEGTKAVISQLKNLTKAGVATYVGGGEGRDALETYGSLEDVTHAFTCGGTILKSLTDKHIAFVKAMYLQKQQS